MMTSEARKDSLEDPAAHVLARVPFCPRIGGRRMVPLTLGHVSLLMSMECAYVGRGACTRADSLVVWDLCSRSMEKAYALVSLMSRKVFTRRERLRRWWWMKRMALLGGSWGFTKLSRMEKELTEYVDSYFVLPPQWDPKGNTNPDHQSVPWPEHVATVLSCCTEISREDAYRLPVNEAVIRFLHYVDMKGGKRLMTPYEIKAFSDE